MHPCLRIPEVMHLVCGEVDKPTALALALTCKTFLDPALDRLWNEIYSFDPIIACLSSDLVKTVSGQRPYRHLVNCQCSHSTIGA